MFVLGVGLSELLCGTLVADYYGAEQFPSVNGVLSTFVAGLAYAASGSLFAAGRKSAARSW